MTLFHLLVISWKVEDQLDIGESLLTCRITIATQPLQITQPNHPRLNILYQTRLNIHNPILLFQRKYALKLHKDTGLLDAKPISCLLDPNIKLQKQGSDLFLGLTAYRRLIGRLVYLTNTTPDISYSVGLLSQFLDKPVIEHHNAALRVLKDVKSSSTLGLCFPSTSNHKLTAFADADWGSFLDTRRLTTRYCFFYGKALISGKSKK